MWPGNSILLNGVVENANPEIGVPGLQLTEIEGIREIAMQESFFLALFELAEDFRLVGEGRIQDQGVRQFPQAGNKY